MSLHLAAAVLNQQGAAVAKTIQFRSAASSATNGTTYTFSAMDIGTADSDRSVLVCVGSRKAGVTAYSVSSVTVAGIVATEMFTVANQVSNSSIASIWRADVPTGTTGDVVVTLNTSSLRCGIAVYRCTGITGSAPASTASDVTSSDASLSVSLTANGIAVATGKTGASGASHAWTGDFIEDADFDVGGEGTWMTAGSASSVSASSKSATITPAAWANEHVYIAAAW